ncbi:MAG TPA: VWA domain-containing protein [Candidatus Lustribacter sp.]|jgi:Ca-activated chloride channel family protein|nr:VWA domain-containing protein [Candidatus Lustribacter sp.]
MTFAHPLFFVLAVLVAAAFLALAIASYRRARGAALTYSNLAFLESAIGRAPPWTALFTAVWVLAILVAGGALARPSIMATVAVHDAALVLCIDTSGSMASTDVAPTRSDASREAALTFINGVPDGTRIGLVAFSAAAFPLGPLSADRDVARDALSRLPEPNGGTAIGDALAAAAHMLPPGGRRAIVLVTDGVNNAGSDPLAVASEIGAQGISIFTIGIGTNGSGQLIPGTEENAELDEDALRSIAASGNGSYARVGDAAALQEKLGSLARSTIVEKRRVDLTVPCAVAAGVLAFGATLGALALGRFP